ncbi:MAG: hypothetical protein C0457_22940, partial [Polymorphum sp.]|nr:hypothetical protein [Polymorphum sp.]
MAGAQRLLWQPAFPCVWLTRVVFLLRCHRRLCVGRSACQVHALPIGKQAAVAFDPAELHLRGNTGINHRTCIAGTEFGLVASHDVAGWCCHDGDVPDCHLCDRPDGATAAGKPILSRFSGRDWWFIGLLGTIYAFNFIDRMIIAVVGEPIRQEFGLSDFQLGIMGGAAFALFYGGIGVPLARLAERVNRIGIVATATALWSVMTIISGAATGYIQLLLARMGVGVGEAGFTPPVVSLIADRFPPERRATVFSM